MKNEIITKNDTTVTDRNMSVKLHIISALLALLMLTAGSVAANAATCSFKAGAYAIAFGNLDPSIGANVTMAVAPAMSFKCPPPIPSFTITVNAGLHPSGGVPRLADAALANFINYSVSISPTAGAAAGGFQPLTMTATVNGVDYRNAAAGAYTDTLTLTILP